MSPLMYGVVSCHDPDNARRGPCCLAPTPPPPWFCPEYHFSWGRMWRWVWGLIHVCGSFDIWQRKYADGGERQEICLRSHVWERWPDHVNMNEGGKLMLLPFLPLSLSLSPCYLFTFCSVSTQPLQFLCQTWQMQSEGGYWWIWLPSLSSLMSGCKKIRAVCSAVLDGKGQLVNQPVFLPSEFISIGSRET